MIKYKHPRTGKPMTITVGDLFRLKDATIQWNEENGLWVVLAIKTPDDPTQDLMVISTNGIRREVFFPEIEEIEVLAHV